MLDLIIALDAKSVRSVDEHPTRPRRQDDRATLRVGFLATEAP